MQVCIAGAAGPEVMQLAEGTGLNDEERSGATGQCAEGRARPANVLIDCYTQRSGKPRVLCLKLGKPTA